LQFAVLACLIYQLVGSQDVCSATLIVLVSLSMVVLSAILNLHLDLFAPGAARHHLQSQFQTHNGVISSVLSCSKLKTLSHHHGYNISASQHDLKFSGWPLNDCHSQKPESHNFYESVMEGLNIVIRSMMPFAKVCASCSVKRTC